MWRQFIHALIHERSGRKLAKYMFEEKILKPMAALQLLNVD
jgi:hypothetical protein